MKKKICIAVYSILAIALLILMIMNFVSQLSFMLFLFSAGFAFGALNSYNDEDLKKCTKYVCGTVVEVERVDINLKGLVAYRPIVEYTVDERVYRTRFNIGGKKNDYRVGDDFWLFYDPEDPTLITQENEKRRSNGKILGIVSAISGALCVLFVLLDLFGG